MAVVTVNEDVCKGCALCVDACPKHIMELDTSHLNKRAITRPLQGSGQLHRMRVLCYDVPRCGDHVENSARKERKAMKKLLKGNEAIAEAAIQAGCRFFFGYPITPQNQIPEYMSKRMPR